MKNTLCFHGNFLSGTKLLFGGCQALRKFVLSNDQQRSQHAVLSEPVQRSRTEDTRAAGVGAVGCELSDEQMLLENTNESKTMFHKSISFSRFQQNMGLFFLQVVVKDADSGKSWKPLDFACITHRATMLSSCSSYTPWQEMTTTS